MNEYLKNKLNLQNKNTNLVEQKNANDDNIAIESGRISNTQQVGQLLPEQYAEKSGKIGQPEQNGNYNSGQRMGSNDAGNGFAGTERSNLGNRDRGGRPDDNSQQNDDEKNEGREHSLGGIVSGRIVSDRRESGGRVSNVSENSTQNDELEKLISKYKGQKLTNEQVSC